MPAISPAQLNRALIDAWSEQNAIAINTSGLRGNPRHYAIQAGAEHFPVWVYIWTLTHGGGSARPELEFRVQITGVSSPLAINPHGPTLLMGYEPDTGCFAGFDITKHATFSTNSPSIQIPITTLHSALQYGFSFTRKGNDEIAIGIRPDQLLTYTLNAYALHEQGADAQISDLLTKATSLAEIPTTDMEGLTPERQRVVSTVSRLSRDASFRRKVVNAYERRCAVTRLQLGLVEAAHILPVGVEGSTDEVSNGLCLSPTYHRAFDRALIYLDESLVMRLNLEKLRDLEAQGLTGGLAAFQSYLDIPIHMPHDRAQWPNVALILQANRSRGILT